VATDTGIGIDRIMEEASRRLVATDYLEAERLCLEALSLARGHRDFGRYARILLPLQEVRRQRRQFAVEAGVFLIAGDRLEAGAILARHRQGCLLLAQPPYEPGDEQAVRDLARKQSLFVEVLLLGPEQLRACFEDQMEQVGDAAVSAIADDAPLLQRLDALADAVQRVGDHEIAHQRLAAVARALIRETPPAHASDPPA